MCTGKNFIARFFDYRSKTEKSIGTNWRNNSKSGWITTLRVFLMDMFCTMLFVSVILLPAVRGYSMETTAAVEGVSVFAYTTVFMRENVGFLNPLWLFAVYIAGRSPFPWWMMFIQLVSMILGWILGTAINDVMTIGITPSAGLGAPALNPLYTIGQGLFAETFGTILAFGVPLFYMLSLSRNVFYGGMLMDKNNNANLLFPFVVSFLHVGAFIFSFDVSKSSFNWFRYLFPTIIGGTFDASTQWFYFVGPLLGAVIPGILFTFIAYVAKFGNPTQQYYHNVKQQAEAAEDYESL